MKLPVSSLAHIESKEFEVSAVARKRNNPAFLSVVVLYNLFLVLVLELNQCLAYFFDYFRILLFLYSKNNSILITLVKYSNHFLYKCQ